MYIYNILSVETPLLSFRATSLVMVGVVKANVNVRILPTSIN